MKGCRSTSTARSCRAFTLVELLVIVAVVGILVALQIPALANAQRRTKIAQCAENLKQVTFALTAYAHDHNDRLPGNAGVFWAWDLSRSTANLIVNTCGSWKVAFCPGTGPRFTDADNFTLFNFAGYAVTGYATSLPDTSTVNSANWNITLTPPTIQVSPGVFSTPLASERVLLADVTISASGQNNENLRYSPTYNYTQIIGGFPKAHLTSHLTGRFPLGGNVSMLDGHVEWRDFDDMHVRTTGGSPTFWW